MSILVRDGTLSRTINSAGSKLVAVDFSNPNCPPCRAIHPYWESLVLIYKNVVFCTVQCDDCPTEARQYQIHATPTFVFIKNGNEVARIVGADKNQIKQTIEKHMSSCVGTAHTLGPVAPQQDFWETLRQKREQQLKAQQQGSQPTEAPKPKPAAPKPQPSEIPKPAPVAPAPAKPSFTTVPEGIKSTLLDMGFTDNQILKAYKGTNGGDVDAILDYIEQHQNEPEEEEIPQPQSQPSTETEPSQPEPSPEQPQQSGKSAQVANDLMKPLTPEGEAVKNTLVEMGYDDELAHMAINSVGPDSIDRCIEIIGKIERGEPIPMPKHQKTQEEIDAKIREYQERIKEKRAAKEAEQSPKARAQSELERRKQVLEQLELKKKIEEQKREQALRDMQREKIRDKMEREKVKARIQAQREEQKRRQNGGAAAPQPQPQQNVQQHQQQQSNAPKVHTECTLRLVLPDGTAKVQKFAPNQTLEDVYNFLRQNVSGVRVVRNVSFEIAFPHRVLTRNNFAETLSDLKLVPRAQLMVKY
ncbi:Thioredoxin family protein [Histomonas meleagridis]|uniref:Thioredoxin family protein n=1 Tax=Histomonas meleagridis TaxID=135588 RepID=UPI00355AA0DD|nr:Thioredoxin family protein [Histomonas meleagridis]KAH0799068.1 Thioredoxin family protein [Histomonas meleagridis]